MGGRLMFPADGPSADTLVSALQQPAVGTGSSTARRRRCSFVVEEFTPRADRFSAAIDEIWSLVFAGG
jgi:hypothetical protein